MSRLTLVMKPDVVHPCYCSEKGKQVQCSVALAVQDSVSLV